MSSQGLSVDPNLDDRILKELTFADEDSASDIECSTCDIKFSSMKAYNQHLNGKRHNKMVHKLKIKSKVSELNNLKKEISDREDENVEVSDDDGEINCIVCEMFFSGHESYYAHLKGSVHMKNLKKEKLKNKLKDMPEVLKKDESESEDEDGILTKPFARCETCRKEFNGPESFHQHIRGPSHKKKNRQKSVMASIKSKSSEGLDDNEEDGGNNLECKICVKSFSGPIPHHIHMKSLLHKKEVKKAEMICKIKDFCQPFDDEKIFICKECGKRFTDPFALKAHLESNDHLKQKERKEMQDFLVSHPEIMMVKAIENDDSDDENTSSFFFVCKICHVSLSGPENAKLHAKSKKHITARKERKSIKDFKALEAEKRGNTKEAVEETDVSKLKEKAATNDGTGDKKSLNVDKVTDSGHDEFEII